MELVKQVLLFYSDSVTGTVESEPVSVPDWPFVRYHVLIAASQSELNIFDVYAVVLVERAGVWEEVHRHIQARELEDDSPIVITRGGSLTLTPGRRVKCKLSVGQCYVAACVVLSCGE